MPRALAGLLLPFAFTLPAVAHMQAPQNEAEVPVAVGTSTATPPFVDGRLDDAVWASAPVITDFVQHEPFEGRPATERTEIRVLYDDTAIYIGAWMFDRDPSGILTGENRRDADLRDADALLIVLDTYRDRQNGFVFGTTPAGIEYDGQVVRNGEGGLSTSRRAQGGAGAAGGFNLNWDGSWEVATSIDEAGWYAEFRIPFSTLRYGGGGEQTWGLNVSRTVRRTNEEDFWAPIPRQFTLYRVSQAGVLEGIETPTRRTLQVTPYALSSARRDFTADTSAWDAEFGGDAKIGLTPGLNLDLTYNTDFAQVEVDEQQINLTRFSLFFPEKRPFFLENAGTFTVGIPRAGSDLGMDLFYSRRIGIGEAGELVPIVGGGRLTGKVGGFTVGLLDIQTERVSASAIPANNYSVGRIIRELPNRSQLGGMLINRINTDSTGDHNVTYSVDGRWGIGESTNLDLWLAGTETPGLGGREHAIGFTGSYRTRDWDLGLQYREVGENFNPEVGFLPRAGFRGIIVRVQRGIRVPSATWLRELRPHMLVRDFFGFDGFNQTRYIHLDNTVNFTNGSLLSTAINIRREGLQAPFDITDGVTIPTGTYDFVESLLRFNTNESAMWSVGGVVTLGGFFSGHRKSFQSTITNRLGTTWTAALRFNYDNVDLPEGSFANTLASLRLAYSFTPRIFLQSLIQYNSQTDNMSGNVRFGWLNTAGTGLYIVFNQLQQTVEPTGPLDRALVVKFTHQFGLVQ
ncbi:MAG: DUF5916 domain-containing protein [Gemmatimonadetes bacterium]|nr:DUF5916 domain-containing protein [Gemmatimonadota bacterium]